MAENEEDLPKEVGAELLRLALAQAQSGWAAWDSLDRKLTAVFAQSITLALASAGATAAAMLGQVQIPRYLGWGVGITGLVFVLAGLFALSGLRPGAAKPYGARPKWAISPELEQAGVGTAMLMLAWQQSDVWEHNEHAMRPIIRALKTAQVLLVAAVPLGVAAALIASRWAR